MKGLVTTDLKGTTSGKILEVSTTPSTGGGFNIIEVDKPAAVSSSVSMEFYFPAESILTYTRTIGTLQAATYNSVSLNNVASYTLKKNGTTASLPLTLAAGNTLEVTIVRTAAGTSILTLTT
jgi:hypothetical protein